MAEPHNNGISLDTIDIRLYRLLRMQNNIDAYAVALGVSGALLAWAQACYDRFSGAVTSAGVEDGESKDATIILHDLWATFGDYYQQAKDILEAKLAMFKPDEHLQASYGVDKRTPETYHDLITAANEMIAKHDELVLSGDERVIAQAIINQLTIHRNNFVAQVETAGIERRESDEAFNLQHSYFDEDTENLRYIFTIAKLIWGDDDPKLKDLGFVPASEIWTPGQPSPTLPPWPGPMESFTLRQVMGMILWVEVVVTRIVGCPRCVLEREQDGTGVWEYVTEFDLEAEELWPFREKVPFAGIWHYRATPFNAEGEPGIASEGTVEVTE